MPKDILKQLSDSSLILQEVFTTIHSSNTWWSAYDNYNESTDEVEVSFLSCTPGDLFPSVESNGNINLDIQIFDENDGDSFHEPIETFLKSWSSTKLEALKVLLENYEKNKTPVKGFEKEHAGDMAKQKQTIVNLIEKEKSSISLKNKSLK